MFSRLPIFVPVMLVVAALGLPAGCTSPIHLKGAKEVSRDRLYELADADAGNHMIYRGSDRSYHYVDDRRPGKEASYKVRSDGIPLDDTFDVGADQYVLWPWLIKGDRLGTKPE